MYVCSVAGGGHGSDSVFQLIFCDDVSAGESAGQLRDDHRRFLEHHLGVRLPLLLN